MLTTVLFTAALTLQGQVVVQGGPPPKPVPRDAPAALPETPQGKQVKAYIDAFNAGDEAAFLKKEEALMSSETLGNRPAADRARMYGRMKGDFGTLKVKRAVADGNEIRAVILDKDGNEAIFVFQLEPAAPYKIKSIGVDIGNTQR